LLIPPPPKVLAVEGQTVTVTATYKGNQEIDGLTAFWIVTAANKDQYYLFPDINKQPGYNVTLEQCVVINHIPNCCQFYISIVVESVTVGQSGTKLSSAGARQNLKIFTEGKSIMGKVIYVA